MARAPLGRVKVHGPTRQLRRRLGHSRFRPTSVTVSYEHHRWWVSIAGLAAAFHTDRHTHARRGDIRGAPRPAKSDVPVGVDFGVRTLATAADTDGRLINVWEGVKSLRAAQGKLRRANKALARTKPGSGGRSRAVDKLRRIHARVHAQRQDLLHQMSSWLVDHHQTVVVEDLNVAGILADRCVAFGAADQALATLRQMLTYKASWYGSALVVADRFYPSSKTCSIRSCGQIHASLGRGEVRWKCPGCGTEHDRDHNAAVNLARWSARSSDKPSDRVRLPVPRPPVAGEVKPPRGAFSAGRPTQADETGRDEAGTSAGAHCWKAAKAVSARDRRHPYARGSVPAPRRYPTSERQGSP